MIRPRVNGEPGRQNPFFDAIFAHGPVEAGLNRQSRPVRGKRVPGVDVGQGQPPAGTRTRSHSASTRAGISASERTHSMNTASRHPPGRGRCWASPIISGMSSCVARPSLSRMSDRSSPATRQRFSVVRKTTVAPVPHPISRTRAPGFRSQRSAASRVSVSPPGRTVGPVTSRSMGTPHNAWGSNPILICLPKSAPPRPSFPSPRLP